MVNPIIIYTFVLTKTETDMKTKITPYGIVLNIVYDGKTYLGVIQNDFDRFKTFGNYDLSVDSLILFDEDFNKLSFSDKETKRTCELYDIIEDLIEKIVVNEEYDDDEDDDIDPAGGHGIHSHI